MVTGVTLEWSFPIARSGTAEPEALPEIIAAEVALHVVGAEKIDGEARVQAAPQRPEILRV